MLISENVVESRGAMIICLKTLGLKTIGLMTIGLKDNRSNGQ